MNINFQVKTISIFNWNTLAEKKKQSILYLDCVVVCLRTNLCKGPFTQAIFVQLLSRRSDAIFVALESHP